MEGLALYNAVRAVPESATKKITGGRLNGKTDINPMWRIKTLTEQFGPCGIGWFVEILEQWLTPGANNEVAAHVKIALRIKTEGEWSQPILGIGGSMFIANERSGAYTSDECFKMAYTDAISVACKMLGIGADVYWEADKTKYDRRPAAAITSRQPAAAPAKKQLTMAILKDSDKCDKFLMWMYGHWVNAGYPEDFDTTAVLRKSYEADAETVKYFVNMFNSYKQARNGK